MRLRDRVCTVTHAACSARIARARTCCARRGTVPRRREDAEVIGEALALALDGLGHRQVARRLGRPEGTARGCLRAARSRAKLRRACGTRWMTTFDSEPGLVLSTTTRLGDAVEAVMLAVRAWRLRFGAEPGP